jgi:hypothetical protein
MARTYAKSHLETDPAIRSIYYLPTDAPQREIRFVEVNELIADRGDQWLEPIEFGIDTGSDCEHRLLVLDVTPGQWDRIRQSQLALPAGWSLDKAVRFPK